MRIVPPNVQERARAVSRTLWIVLGLNLLVAASKFAVGQTAGTLALVADAIHSAFDASSNVIALVGIRVARTPPDAGHPYGHQRFETLAALTVGLLIGFGFLGLINEAISALGNDRAPPRIDAWTIGVVLGTLLINLGVSRYEAARGRALGSGLLAADAAHTASDAYASTAVLVGFGLVHLGLSWGDLLAALVVSVFIAIAAWNVLRDNISVLADAAPLDAEALRAIVLSVDGVRGTHRIRSRGSPDYVLVDLHVHLDPVMPLTDAHAKSHEVAAAIRHALPQVMDVVIHTEPADGRELTR